MYNRVYNFFESQQPFMNSLVLDRNIELLCLSWIDWKGKTE